MRSLVVTLYSSKPFSLPLAYNHCVQGLLYSCWRDAFPELHDTGYGDGGSRLRMFVFGPLEGPHRISKEKGEIVFDGTASFEVRTPDEPLLDELAARLAARGTARIGSRTLELCNLMSRDRLIFPGRAVVRMRSPVTLHRTADGSGHTEFVGPDDGRFCEMCRSNLERKLRAMGADGGDAGSGLRITPLSETVRKRVTRFKGTWISAWTGRFAVAADPRSLCVLYHTGLGDRNSQGFGMFDIEDAPPGLGSR